VPAGAITGSLLNDVATLRIASDQLCVRNTVLQAGVPPPPRFVPVDAAAAAAAAHLCRSIPHWIPFTDTT
jgi:hypothetical protein